VPQLNLIEIAHFSVEVLQLTQGSNQIRPFILFGGYGQWIAYLISIELYMGLDH
jgi:hypothetical protein